MGNSKQVTLWSLQNASGVSWMYADREDSLFCKEMYNKIASHCKLVKFGSMKILSRIVALSAEGQWNSSLIDSLWPLLAETCESCQSVMLTEKSRWFNDSDLRNVMVTWCCIGASGEDWGTSDAFTMMNPTMGPAGVLTLVASLVSSVKFMPMTTLVVWLVSTLVFAVFMFMGHSIYSSTEDREFARGIVPAKRIDRITNFIGRFLKTLLLSETLLFWLEVAAFTKYRNFAMPPNEFCPINTTLYNSEENSILIPNEEEIFLCKLGKTMQAEKHVSLVKARTLFIPWPCLQFIPLHWHRQDFFRVRGNAPAT